jgi:enoyl-CoA hydratase/carnithine racemase
VSTVRVERDGRIAWLTLDRPDAANALSKALVADLRAAVASFYQAEKPLPVLVLTGAGDKAFCAGADLKERRAMSLDDARAFLKDLHALLSDLESYSQPVIAALNGAAYGGGLELALACDIRLAVEGIEVGLPEVRLGIIPGAGGTQRLARLCGLAAAKELILTGRHIPVARARELGLVSAVIPGPDFRAEVLRWATEIATAGPLAVSQAKGAIDDGFGDPLPHALEIERARYEVVLTSEDRNEGLRAFAEKRKPAFTGK